MNVLEISFADPLSVRPMDESLLFNAHRAIHSNTIQNRLEVKDEERDLIEALRRGDEVAFGTLIDRYHSRLLRLAMTFVPSEAIAEEVVQETWMNVLTGINRFEGRSSVKTWIFQLLINRAKTRGRLEKRYVSLTDFGSQQLEEEDHEIGPKKFHTSDPLAKHWANAPHSWEKMTPERCLLSKECGEQIEQAIRRLPAVQQKVMILRDVEGVDVVDICAMLRITHGNLRVRLHRARTKVREFLDVYLRERSPTAMSSSRTEVPMPLHVVPTRSV